MGWEGIGTLIGKISQQFQGRIERLKNEKTKLEQERKTLINGVCGEKQANRVIWIDNRIAVINGLLSSKANDN
jgi:hypothetical protein